MVRVWLPDRPGALGLVASRIGAIGGDIVGIDVLERSEHVAVDEFAVMLPDRDLVSLLVREIEEVDGASVEEWREVATFPDPRLDALESVEHLSGASTAAELMQRLVDSVRDEFAADWAVMLHGDVALAIIGRGRSRSLGAGSARGGHRGITESSRQATPGPTTSPSRRCRRAMSSCSSDATAIRSAGASDANSWPWRASRTASRTILSPV